jgi:hypothetical protein
MSSEQDALRKIHREVLKLAAEDEARDIDVMIELNLPTPVLTAKAGLFGSRLSRLTAVTDEAAAVESGEAFRRFGAYLDSVSSGRPAPLRGANAYAVTLPARELLEVAKAPLVSSVTPNWHRQA